MRRTSCASRSGQFLADNERLFSTETPSEVAVVYSRAQLVGARAPGRRGAGGQPAEQLTPRTTPFWAACRALATARQPYDVVMFPDGELRADTITADQLGRYATVVLPDVDALTEQQASALAGYAASGGRIVLPAGGAPLWRRRMATAAAGGELLAALAGGPQVEVVPDEDVAVLVHRTEDGAAVHVLRYGYDAGMDAVPVLPALELLLRLPGTSAECTVHSPSAGASVAGVRRPDGRLHLRLTDVPLYSIVEIGWG